MQDLCWGCDGLDDLVGPLEAGADRGAHRQQQELQPQDGGQDQESSGRFICNRVLLQARWPNHLLQKFRFIFIQ